jgi:hypothetical protein
MTGLNQFPLDDARTLSHKRSVRLVCVLHMGETGPMLEQKKVGFLLLLEEEEELLFFMVSLSLDLGFAKGSSMVLTGCMKSMTWKRDCSMGSNPCQSILFC